MPSQPRKRDNVSKNMGARYAPIEGALRSKPHTVTIDLSGSVTAPSGPLFGPPSSTPAAPPKFFDPSSLNNSVPAQSMFYKKDQEKLQVKKDQEKLQTKKEEEPSSEKAKVDAPVKPTNAEPANDESTCSNNSDEFMDWEPAPGTD